MPAAKVAQAAPAGISCTPAPACRFIAEAGDAAVATEGVAHGVVMQAQILHTYLPAVHVELSIESGGSVEKGSDARLLVIQVCNQLAAVDAAMKHVLGGLTAA